MFGLLICKLIVKRLLDLYTLIFVKKYNGDLNTLRTLSELGKPKFSKNDLVYVGPWGPYLNFLKNDSVCCKKRLEIYLG